MEHVVLPRGSVPVNLPEAGNVAEGVRAELRQVPSSPLSLIPAAAARAGLHA